MTPMGHWLIHFINGTHCELFKFGVTSIMTSITLVSMNKLRTLQLSLPPPIYGEKEENIHWYPKRRKRIRKNICNLKVLIFLHNEKQWISHVVNWIYLF